ncbi:unnamed protein product, partial [Heterosigma akashiwo]
GGGPEVYGRGFARSYADLSFGPRPALPGLADRGHAGGRPGAGLRGRAGRVRL